MCLWIRLCNHTYIYTYIHTYIHVLCLPRRCFLRLLLFCTCPPLCAGALWPMPAWVWRDVRFCFYIHTRFCTSRRHSRSHRTSADDG